MGIVKAISKLGAKSVNRSYTNSQVRKAPAKAYKQTGKQMSAAKRRGEYVDGATLFRKNKANNIRTARQHGKDREVFIDDL
jgi:hypothetical protein